ncbi:MAG: hypothetical protein Q4G33_01295 [bacterium]|nr:hypothetical protein [bacterium]
MAKYSKPIIDVLYFDEEEVVTASTPEKGRYAADLMNEYFFGEGKASQTTTVNIQQVKVTDN